MSPEQMEQMKKMGLKMPEIQEGGMIVKVCITKEMTERDQPPHMAHKDSGCEMKNFSRNSDGYSMDMVCDGPNMSGTGKVVGKYASPESFNSTYDFTGTAHGHPMNTHNETSGKWLGSDCGDVKPASEMMKNAEMMKNK
jgi:hypothetical protein